MRLALLVLLLGVTARGALAGTIYRESWAVLIGINHYQHAPSLNYAVADAHAVKKLLIQKFGFKPDRIFTLTDAQATRENILKVFAGLDRAGEEDRVIVFFAGHGTQIDLPTGGEMGFLVPVDGKIASRSELVATSIPMQHIRDFSHYIPAKHVLFLVDACYGGLATVNPRSLPADTARYLAKITAARARQIITAGGKGEAVVERSDWGHSAFTYKLLDGLGRELADLNGDGIITSTELSTWLKANVAAATGSRQLPQFKSFTEDEGDVVFVLAPPAEPQPPVAATPAEPSIAGAPGDQRIMGRHRIRFRILRAEQLPEMSPPKGTRAQETEWAGLPCFFVTAVVNQEPRQRTREHCLSAESRTAAWNQDLAIDLDPAVDQLAFLIVARQETAFAGRLWHKSTREVEVGKVTIPKRSLKVGEQTLLVRPGIQLFLDVQVADIAP